MKRAVVLRGTSSLSPKLQASEIQMKAPETPLNLPWKQQVSGAISENVGSSSPYQVTFSHPSKSSNSPRILDAAHFKKAIPYQKTVWSADVDDVLANTVDSIAEKPQHELAIHLKRDVIEPIPTEMSLKESADCIEKKNPITALRHFIERLGKRSQKADKATGLVVRDETFWKWYVQDNYRFKGKPRHLTWEQFASELGSYSFYWELHPQKPEDYYILHILKHEDPLDKQSKREVIWSAMHAVWESPVLMDLYAALGTMMKGKLKTRTLSFDDGRGTIKELNLQHVSPYTTAIQINARPPYFYDRDLRDIREENSTWYFSKELITNPGINEDGTISYYISAEAVAYHLTASVRMMLNRPMHDFYRKGTRKRIKHYREYDTHSDRLTNTVRAWCAFEKPGYNKYPAIDQLDAVTDHWLEESPYPLRDVHDKIRALARLQPENLQYLRWLQCNREVTRDTAYHLATDYAPGLLQEGSSFRDMLLPPSSTLRTRIHPSLTEGQLEDLKLLREAEEARDAEAELAREKMIAGETEKLLSDEGTSQEDETSGKKRQQERITIDPIEERKDSEQWSWIHDTEEKSSSGTVSIS